MRFLREPLLHFLLLGAVIFAAYSFLSDNTQSPDDILVTQGKIENLATTFAKTWHRPPIEEELNGLIRDYVREEIAYREALALGLDQDDTIIRRRLRQKLEFLSEDLAAVEPTDSELQTYLKSHASDYAMDPILTFRHVYLNPENHGANLKPDADAILAELRKADTDEASYGDSLLIGHDFNGVTASEISRMFGEKFAAGLLQFTPGEWQGPIESGYGLHLVFINQKKEGKLPELEEVRDAVKRDWANEKRVETSEKFYQALLHRYTVTIEPPQEKKLAEMQDVK